MPAGGARAGSRAAASAREGRQVTALWVTHRLEELAFADTASFMDNGRMQVRRCKPAGLPLGCVGR